MICNVEELDGMDNTSIKTKKSSGLGPLFGQPASSLPLKDTKQKERRKVSKRVNRSSIQSHHSQHTVVNTQVGDGARWGGLGVVANRLPSG